MVGNGNTATYLDGRDRIAGGVYCEYVEEKYIRVLIACEFSGVVRDAFAAKGHDAWSCDILPTERSGNHIQRDVLEILNDGWDLMIAHPPCTYLSNAGARFLYPKGVLNTDRLAQGLDAKELFMALLNADIPRICIENPIPSSAYLLPAYNQIIQPSYFGHPFQKRTCLWLKNLPPLMSTGIYETAESSKIAGNWFNKGGKERQKNRAKTFQGIADAMSSQWSDL